MGCFEEVPNSPADLVLQATLPLLKHSVTREHALDAGRVGCSQVGMLTRGNARKLGSEGDSD